MTESRPNADELSRSLTSGHQAGERTTLRLGECVIALDSNSAQLIDELRDYFAPFLAEGAPPSIVVTALEATPPAIDLPFRDWPREPGKDRRKEEFAEVERGRVVRKVRTGMQFVIGASTRLAIGPCLANVNQVVNFVNSQYMTWLLDQGWLLCHAAALAQDGSGIGIAGISGGGKSTLVLHMLRPGLTFVSNDRLLIRRTPAGMVMSGVPKHPRINPGTALHNEHLTTVLPAHRRRVLANLPDEELWHLEEKYDADVTRLYDGVAFELTARLHAFIVLDWHRDSTAPTTVQRVRLADRPDLLGAIMKSPGPFHLPTRDLATDPTAYLGSFADLPVYEIAGAVDFALARAACARILARP